MVSCHCRKQALHFYRMVKAFCSYCCCLVSGLKSTALPFLHEVYMGADVYGWMGDCLWLNSNIMVTSVWSTYRLTFNDEYICSFFFFNFHPVKESAFVKAKVCFDQYWTSKKCFLLYLSTVPKAIHFLVVFFLIMLTVIGWHSISLFSFEVSVDML